MAPPVAPSTDGYYIGKGHVVFKRDGDSEYIHLGNVPEFEFTPTSETLDHFSSMEGVKSKDKTVILTAGGELRIVMEEATANNLSMINVGSIDNTDPDRPKVNIFDINAVAGEVRFYATNEVGPWWDGVFTGVDFLPTGSFNPISEEFGQMEVTGQIRKVGGSFGYWQFRPKDAAVPVNIANPMITGTPEVGQVLTASTGVWLNEPTSYAYQWKADGVDIGSATNSTFTITGTQVGAVITVAVTASNATGAGAPAISAGTTAVDPS